MWFFFTRLQGARRALVKRNSIFCLGSETSSYRKIQQGFRASCLQATKKGMFASEPKLRGTAITTAIKSWQIEYLWIGARDGLQKIQQLVIIPEHH